MKFLVLTLACVVACALAQAPRTITRKGPPPPRVAAGADVPPRGINRVADVGTARVQTITYNAAPVAGPPPARVAPPPAALPPQSPMRMGPPPPGRFPPKAPAPFVPKRPFARTKYVNIKLIIILLSSLSS